MIDERGQDFFNLPVRGASGAPLPIPPVLLLVAVPVPLGRHSC